MWHRDGMLIGGVVADADAPAIMATYSEEDQAYWSSDERMGEKDRYKKICAQDEGELKYLRHRCNLLQRR